MTEDAGLVGRWCGQQLGEITRDPSHESPRSWRQGLGQQPG